jgi:hypothetical protein
LLGLAACSALTLAVLLPICTGRRAEAADREDFDGWIVRQWGKERRFPRAENWKVTTLTCGFRVEREGECVVYYGTFVAEALERLAADTMHEHQHPADFRGWTVYSDGEPRKFWMVDGWQVSHNPGGVFLHARGAAVWYYGTHRLEGG